MKRSASLLFGVTSLLAVSSLAWLAPRDARACGGCFQPPPSPREQPSVITDHRMVLSISPQQTTLYDQIRYSGAPSAFAWVLPIAGEATVGLSSDALFQTLDQLTQTTVVAPPLNCPAPPRCGTGSGGGCGSVTSLSASAEDRNGATFADAGVSVTHHEVVGPYETVQLHSTDPNALNTWLASHGFSIPDDVKPIVAAYVNEHFDFLALKLVPGAGVQSMRPVRVTTRGAAPVLPLRMVAAGTGAVVGITLWVLADGRYEPQNAPIFRVKDADLVWDWTAKTSNFKSLRQDAESALGGKGWESECSLALAQQQVRNGLQPNFGNPPGADAGADYLPVIGDGGVSEGADQVRQDDLRALFAGIGTLDGQVRVTRLRADLAHAALATDLALTASADQSTLTNVRQATREANEPQCPIYDTSNCSQVGTAPRSQAASSTRDFSCATSAEPVADRLWLIALAAMLGLAGIRAAARRLAIARK